MKEVRRFKDFEWPLADGVSEEWVTLTTQKEGKGKQQKVVVLSREVQHVVRGWTWRERIAQRLNAWLA